MANRGGLSQLGARPYSAMGQTGHHQRTVTEDLRRPKHSPMQSRGRSNTATLNDFPSQIRAPYVIDQTSGMPSDRRSASISLHSRNERSESFSRTLRTKASRLLRRQENDENLTSLRTVDWSEELDETPYEDGPSLLPRRGLKVAKRGSPSGGMPSPDVLSLVA